MTILILSILTVFILFVTFVLIQNKKQKNSFLRYTYTYSADKETQLKEVFYLNNQNDLLIDLINYSNGMNLDDAKKYMKSYLISKFQKSLDRSLNPIIYRYGNPLHRPILNN